MCHVPDPYRHLHYLIISPNFSVVIPFCTGPVDNKDTISAFLWCTRIPGGAHLLALDSTIDPQVP